MPVLNLQNIYDNMQTNHKFSFQIDNATAFGSFYKEMIENTGTTYYGNITKNSPVFFSTFIT